MEHDDAMRMLKSIAAAFDEHDLDGIMAHFADDAVFEGPCGTEPWGTRFVGRDEVREAFAARFVSAQTAKHGHVDSHSYPLDRSHCLSGGLVCVFRRSGR